MRSSSLQHPERVHCFKQVTASFQGLLYFPGMESSEFAALRLPLRTGLRGTGELARLLASGFLESTVHTVLFP